MKKISILFMMFAVIFAVGCEDTWDKHFNGEGEGEGGRSENNLFDFLSEKPEYSKFVALLNETEAGKELAKNQVLTCWVVSNDSMPDLSGVDAATKEVIVKNHINNMALYAPKLADGKIVKMLSGKNLVLAKAGDGAFSLDTKSLVKMNQLCQNGVAHEISGLMMPRKNIFDYLMDAGDDYSNFRDILLSYSDTLFRPDKSFAIGVNETGNTIYDSVFEITNRFFSKADIRDENNDYTLFLPSNKTMAEAVSDIASFYNKGLTAADTATFINWIMEAVFYKEKIENYNSLGALESVFGKDWRVPYQKIEGEPYEASNGLVYKMQKVHVPLNLLVKSFENKVSTVYAKMSKEQQDKYVTILNASGVTPNNSNRFWITYNASGNDERSFTWTMMDQALGGGYEPARVVPGKYKLFMSFRPYQCGKQDMIANGKVIYKDFDLSGKAGKDDVYYEMGEVVVPEGDGIIQMPIKVQWKSGGDKRLVISQIKLVADPTSIY